jgi:hypothetical protein
MMALTRGAPKELTPVAGVPVLERVARECRASGIEELLIVIAPDKEEIVAHLERVAGVVVDDESHGAPAEGRVRVPAQPTAGALPCPAVERPILAIDIGGTKRSAGPGSGQRGVDCPRRRLHSDPSATNR